MQKIFLVRHGQDVDNAAGILNGRRNNGLTDLGREQAKSAGQKLLNNNIQVIISSPLDRTQETAQIIADELGVKEIITDDRLIERDFGVLTGKPATDIPQYAKNIIHTDKVDYFLDGEGAEDYPTVLKRGGEVLAEIKQKYPDKNILIVTHGGIGKMIQAVCHGWSWEESLTTPFIDNAEVVELA